MIPDMGWHFLNPNITAFDVRKPPILVYGKRGSTWQLVAFEWVFPKKPAKARSGRDVRLVRGGLPLQGRHVRVPGEPGAHARRRARRRERRSTSGTRTS